MNLHFTIFLFFSVLSVIPAQRLPVQIYTKSEGLAHNQVFVIEQDRNGYLWFATGGGISRFNGQHFQSLTVDDGLPGYEIYALALDSIGRIWFGGSQGIGYSMTAPGAVDSIRILSGSENDFIFSTILPLDSMVITGTRLDGVQIFQNGAWYQHPVSSRFREQKANVARLINLPDGRIAGLIQRVGLFVLDDQLNVSAYYQNDTFADMSDIAYHSPDSIIGVTEAGIFVASVQTGEARLDVPFRLPTKLITGYMHARQEMITIGTNRGLLIVNDRTVQWIQKKDGLSSNSIDCTFATEDGQIWAGSDSYGLNLIRSLQVQNFTEKNGRLNQSVNTLVEFRNDIWIGTDDGLFLLTEGQIERPAKPIRLRNEIIWDLLPLSANELMVATEGNLMIIDSRNSAVHHLTIPTTTFIDLEAGPPGVVYISSMSGFLIYKDGYFSEIDSLNELGSKVFWNSLNVADSIVYIGSKAGLIQLEPTTGTIRLLDGDAPETYALALSPDRQLVYASDAGIRVWDDVERIQIHIPFRPAAIISNIYFDPISLELWIAHNYGIDLFDSEFNHIAHMDEQDGLISDEMTTSNAMLRKGAYYYLGMYGGLSQVTAGFHPPTPVVNTHISRIRTQAGTDKPMIQQSPIEFEYENRRLAFYFDRSDYRSGNPHQFRHRLIGYDTVWSEPQAENTVQFTNLPPGDYRFEVEPVVYRKLAGSSTGSVKFTILRPYWLEPGFISFMVILFLALLFGLYRLQVYRIRKQRQQLEIRVKIRTEELLNAKQYTERIIDFAKIGIISLNADGRIDSINQEAADMFNVRKRDMSGELIDDLDASTDSISFRQIIDTLRRAGTWESNDLQKTDRDGRTIYLQLYGNVQLNPINTVTGFTLVMNDVTEIRELASEREKQQKLMGGIEAINQLLATLSHYINNSVASILAMVQLYEETGQFQENVIRITKDHSNRINGVIQSLKMLVENVNLKTRNYAGDPEAIFDIDSDLQHFGEQLEDYTADEDVNVTRENALSTRGSDPPSESAPQTETDETR